jgi:hypothetical protein
MKIDFKIDEKDNEYASLHISNDNGYGYWLLQRSGENYYIISFLKGQIGKTEFQQGKLYKTEIVKSGKGRGSVDVIEKMRNISLVAYNHFSVLR